MSTESKWFVAEAIFQANIQGRAADREPLEEDLLFIVHAIDEPSALAKAETIAREKEHSYENANGQRVVWNFIRLIEVMEMVDQQFEDGAEIKSKMSGRETHRVKQTAACEDTERIKKEIVGARGSRYDVFKTDSGDIVVKPKNGTGETQPTGLNVRDF